MEALDMELVLGVDIWLFTNEMNFDLIGWPHQPPMKMVLFSCFEWKKVMCKIMKYVVQLDIIYVGGCGGHPMNSKFTSLVKSQMSTSSEGNDTLILDHKWF